MRGAFLLSVLVLAVAAAACTPAPGASSVSARAPRTSIAPVVLVPGFELGCVAAADDWDSWREEFLRRGLPADEFVVLHYNSCQPNLVTAAQLEAAVEDVLERSGAPRVHLIAHSMGAITARWCLQYGGCLGKVDQLVTLAGANHGTIWAEACILQFWGRACADMQADSALLAAVNVDESPDGVGIETWVSACELVILPRESAFLEGAVNRDLVEECVDHSGWKTHTPTISEVAGRLVPSATPRPG